MKFLGSRDLRNRPGYVRELAKQDDLVLTANGKPIAILVGVEEDAFEETARAIQHAKAHLTLSRLRRQAAAHGADRLSPAEIEAEIRAVRSRRQGA